MRPHAGRVAESCDVLVLGGGIAGLWALDALLARGYGAGLIEPVGLGTGQTLAAQGIIHGGLKYTLRGLFTPAADAIAGMPERWRASLAGERGPNLTAVRVASPCTWLWRSGSLSSRLGLIGASVGLRSRPEETQPHERPAALAAVPGPVYRVAEPVLDTLSLVDAFRESHRGRMLHARIESITAADGWIVGCGGRRLHSRAIVLAAGAGNAELRRLAGFSSDLLQRRPLHMAMLRGTLPELHGHCVDGAATRVTITTHRAADGGTVWQLGGQLAEEGVDLAPAALIERGADELREVLPGVDLSEAAWATYRVDRAELRTGGGRRPDDAQCVVEETAITLWPTKLALAPRGADLVLEALDRLGVMPHGSAPLDGPPPPCGSPPWERASWTAGSRGGAR